MSKITESARGKDCTIRLPGVCNFDPETTVLAHIGRKRGMGIKCHDIHAIYACSSCHDELDSRTMILECSSQELNRYILDALEETQLLLIEQGLLSWVE